MDLCSSAQEHILQHQFLKVKFFECTVTEHWTDCTVFQWSVPRVTIFQQNCRSFTLFSDGFNKLHCMAEWTWYVKHWIIEKKQSPDRAQMTCRHCLEYQTVREYVCGTLFVNVIICCTKNGTNWRFTTFSSNTQRQIDVWLTNRHLGVIYLFILLWYCAKNCARRKKFTVTITVLQVTNYTKSSNINSQS